MMLNFLYSALLAGCSPAARVFSASPDGKGETVDFDSVMGMEMREIAERKLHHGSNGYYLNFLGRQRQKRGFGRVLYWKLFDKNRFKPYLAAQPVKPVTIDWQPIRNHRGLSVTYVNHASVLIKDIDRCIIVDPVFDGLLWFIKDHSPLAFDLGELPPVDHVLVTHGHYDHLDKSSLAALGPEVHVVAPPGYEGIFDDVGLHRRTRLDWFEATALGDWRVTCLPAHHWTMRNPLVGPNTALWSGFLVRTGSGRTVYLSGDTAYWDGFADIGREADIDLAIINLGAYAPRWFMSQSHLDPVETVAAFRQLRARRLMVVHWGTFRLGDEPVYLPPVALRREMEKAGLAHRLVHLEAGETYRLDT